MDKESKIYIAGHTGVIGSAIWKKFLRKGYKNLVGRSHEALDLMENSKVRDFFFDEKPEYVILAAAFTDESKDSELKQADMIYRNLQIQNNIISECFRHNVKKLIFIACSEIYSPNVSEPIYEELLLSASLSHASEANSITKIAGIKMCESFNIQYKTNYITLVSSKLYGPKISNTLNCDNSIPTILRKIHLSKCLMENNWSGLYKDITKRQFDTLTGNSTIDEIKEALKKNGIFSNHIDLDCSGNTTLDFLWWEDFAEACLFALESLNSKAISEIRSQSKSYHINIGTGEEISLKTLSKKISEIIDYKGFVRFKQQHPHETIVKRIDVSKIHALGWTHAIGINKGINVLYRWYIRDLMTPI